MLGADRSLSDFSVGASFVDGQAFLALRGEVDALTAPEFRAVFETVIDRGHRTIVLDLVGLRFMDASGVAVIARGADRLEAMGGTLTIRTPAALIRRVLEITGFARLVVQGDLEPGFAQPPAALARDGVWPPITISVREFPTVRSDVVATLTPPDADSLLRRLSLEKGRPRRSDHA